MEDLTGLTRAQRLEAARSLASRLMHMHYCDGNARGVADYFAPQLIWLGAGEEQYIAGREAAAEMFCRFGDAIPPCTIWDEAYDVIVPVPGLYVVAGRMWIATRPGVEMYLKVHQRVSFVFQETAQGLRVAHIHCSNPYQELVGGELFPEKIGRQSYEYVQERLAELEAQTLQQNRQLDVILSSVAGGLKISRDDDAYSYAFVSREAAALFGYTVEEFMRVTGGTAVGAVYPPDLDQALADCAEAFKDGGLAYSTRYRIRCKDGSLKWVIDSGKKARDAEGNWMVNSLYLDVTRAEEDARRLRAQKQLLASIYDTVPCGIIRFIRRRDGSCELTSLNPAALSLLGYQSPEEGLRDWHEGVLGAVLEEDRATLRQAYGQLHKVGDRQDREYRARWRDGSLHWLDGTNMVVDVTADGEAVIQRTLIDITQRKLLQQQLEQEQEMYRVAMEAGSSTMFEYQMDTDTFVSYEPRPGQGVIRRALPHYSRLLLDEGFMHPEDAPSARDNICNGRAEMFDVRVVTPDAAPGDYRWHRVSSRLILRDGQPSRVVGTIQDIHAMKETLSANRERLHMSQSALQAISGVYLCIFYVNLAGDSYYAVRLPQVGDTLSFPRSGSYSADLCRRLLPHAAQEDRPALARICDRAALLERLARPGGHTEVEFHQSGAGERAAQWLRLEIHPVCMAQAEARAAIFTLRNVSGEKRRELERQTEEKAAKQALEEAYEGARRANLAKSEFLSRMSHDIRTPMNAILGMASIAERHMDDPHRLADCLDKIRVSGDHLLGLINEVLDMSKIESGSVSLSESAFLLGDTLNAVVQIIRPDAERRGQHLTLRTALPGGAVRGDPMRLQQILLNLLSNAVKYTPEGGHISLAAEEKLSGHSGVACFEFTVEDDGIGIPQEFLGRLFTPFERAEDARVSAVQGTGLGLSITRNLVQMMNGSIRVESEPNRGTRFTVTVYLKREAREAPAPQPAAAPEARRPFPPGTLLLLAEDNALNREIACELLRMNGLETACAENGKQAVELFTAHPPGTYALILMDIQMPVMDGYEATRAIRALARTGERPDAAAIPILALTANAFADDVYRARQAGMNEHVAKPLDVNRLLESLHRWLDRPESTP
ncbi:hypothetical protein CE91St41_28170 [Oscillospiraceae bacterium]|nr:hypothetical protein CE91St40_09370 [Oscillospiraceae bacterium]BDF75928.1 hypothetical protein CE91St41_28170 [Oscillospiraceae bacterium]